MNVLYDLMKNWKILCALTVNDFKTRYAGAQFGMIWAFAQPVVTILIYVFVFQVIAKAAPLEGGFPYVLWLIAGMVPWFFFSEAVMNGTTCLADYSYLVKKVVFQISILPAVRVLSAIFVHLFFVIFVMLIYVCCGRGPSVYYVQILYYMLCIVALAVSISYITASILPFFKDFVQLVNILLMLGMWVCPVMWEYRTILPARYHPVLKLNPVFYIIQGYRDTFVEHVWFWERPVDLIYFWAAAGIIWMMGVRMFQKLSVHFADVL